MKLTLPVLIASSLLLAPLERAPAGEPALGRSEVAFMYASTPEAYKAYGATFVAWGGADTPEAVKMHRDLGIRCTGSVWCLTAGAKALHDDAGLREAVAVDIEGKPIPVPWLFDHIHEGQVTIFGNTNHPAFREHVKAQVRRVMAGGADGLHVDDHLGVASPAHWQGGGFDDHSIAGFRKYLEGRVAAEELTAAGAKDLSTFDYREVVRRFARTAEEVKRKEKEIPLFARWKEFHLEAAASFVEELGRVAAEAAGHPVLLSANACLENRTHHHVVPRLTHVVCEVWFDVHKGTRSLDGALRAFEAAERLKRPLACTASGQDWAHVKSRGLREIVRFWIAFTYANGALFMVPHPSRQWCFTEKLGTHWYAAPVEEYAPLYRFVRSHASLLDGFEAAPDIRPGVPEGLYAIARRKGKALAIHLVNRDYNEEQDQVRPAKDVRLEIQVPSSAPPRKARLFPYGGEPRDISIEVEGDRAVARISEAGLWSVIAIE
jgi:hypothetical protein